MNHNYNKGYEQLAVEVMNTASQALLPMLTAARAGKSSPRDVGVRFFASMDAATAKSSEPLACDGGCSYCCHYHVYLTAFEAFLIAEHIDAQFREEDKKAVIERLEANLRQITGMTAQQHVLTNVACALLSPTGKCSIYPVRPIACRRHHALNATACRVTFEDPASPMVSHKSPYREATAEGFTVAANISCRQVGLDSLYYEMNGALHEAMTNRASLRRWRDGKISFPSVKDRVSGPGA